MKTQNVEDHAAKYDTYYKLKSFIETGEGKQPSQPAVLSRGNYSASDVRYLVEGALNLEYADAGITWESTTRTKDTFTIAMSGGYASQATVDALYLKAVDSASVFFYRIIEEDKFPLLFDAEIISSSVSSLQMVITTVIGKVHRTLHPFVGFDDWTVLQKKGHCTTEDDDDAEYDAGSIMTMAINNYYNQYGCVFYTNTLEFSTLNPDQDPPLTGWGAINTEDITPGDFILDYRTFKFFCDHNSEDCDDFFIEFGISCLPPEAMNYYFQSIINIFTSYQIATELSPATMTEINLSIRTEFGIDIKSWECRGFFGTINYCDSGSDFPFSLPPCCP